MMCCAVMMFLQDLRAEDEAAVSNNANGYDGVVMQPLKRPPGLFVRVSSVSCQGAGLARCGSQAVAAARHMRPRFSRKQCGCASIANIP
jgi:hypothetical protein